MPASFLAAALTLPYAQTQQPPPGLPAAMSGQWTGVLEYRDYSEPASSTRRVQLPTWLTVETTAAGLQFHYIYDDGPSKVVESRATVLLDAAAARWTETEGAHTQQFSVVGLESLHDGRGELILTGQGTENGKPVDQRETVTIRRNLLTLLQETRPAGSSEPFTFRHRYVLTRGTPPAGVSSR